MSESRTDRADRKRKADREDWFLEEMDAFSRRYKIVRSFLDYDKDDQVIKRHLTLEEAQEHCHRTDTRGPGWFDGYSEEN